MSYIFASLVLLFCVPAVFVPSRKIFTILGIAAFALALGVIAVIWANNVSEQMLLNYPFIANSPLHPLIANLFGGILIIFAFGLLLALGARAVFIFTGHLSRR